MTMSQYICTCYCYYCCYHYANTSSNTSHQYKWLPSFQMPSLLFLKTLSKAAAAAAKPILPNGRMLLGQLPPKSPLLPSPQQPLRPSKTFTNSKFAPSKAIHRYLLEPTQNHQLHKGNSPQAATSPNLLQWWLAP